MKLLLTGATGFVGRNLLLRLLKSGLYEHIYLPVRSRAKLASQFHGDGLEGVPASVTPLMTSGPEWKLEAWPAVDHVVHCAGVLWGESRHDFFSMNVDGTLNLLRRLSKPEKVVILSSQAAAGPCDDDEHFKVENGSDNPITWYGQSKLEMERELIHQFDGWNYVVLRPPMILGARDTATLPLFKMARQPIRFKPGFALKRYSFIAVDDLVSAIVTCLQSPGRVMAQDQRVYFVAANDSITDRQLISTAGQALRRRGLVLPIPQPILRGVSKMVDRVPRWRKAIPTLSSERAKEIWPKRWVVSSQAFQDRFDWSPTIDLKTTMQETCEWYRNSGQL